MSKRVTTRMTFGLGALVASPAWGQAAAGDGSLSLSTETGAQVESSTEAEAPDTGAVASGDAQPFEPYEAGYPPDNNLLELGVFGGVFFANKRHNLLDEHFPRQRYETAPEFGARIGYYPASFLGIEAEGMTALARVESDQTRATLLAGRGHLVLQAPLAYVAPFVVGGVGRLGVTGRAMGDDADTAWHFGLGLKVPLTHLLSLRLDGRDNLTA